jgi:hypothetical protein
MDQPGQLIAGVKSLVQDADARKAIGEVVGMRADGVDDFVGVALSAEDLGAFERMVGRVMAASTASMWRMRL